MLEVGDFIPEFELDATNGDLFSSERMDKKTILYFYPKDGTSTCTIEARGFSSVYEDLEAMGLQIIGISPDSIDSHVKFRESEGIPFHLLSDNTSEICSLFGLLQRPSPLELYPIRTTYLVDIDKKILAIWPDLGDVDEDVSTHSDDIVSFIMDVFDKADL